MKIIVEEYFNVLLTIIGGLIIIAIAIHSVLTTNIVINHNEEINHFSILTEKIEIFECKDVLINRNDYELLKNKTIRVADYLDIFNLVKAYSNTNIDIIDNVYARIFESDDKKEFVTFVLKYCNDYRIVKTKIYIKEDSNENNV